MKLIIFALLFSVSLQQQTCPILKCNESLPPTYPSRTCYSYSPENAWLNSNPCENEDHVCNLRESIINHAKGGFQVAIAKNPYSSLDMQKLLIG